MTINYDNDTIFAFVSHSDSVAALAVLLNPYYVGISRDRHNDTHTPNVLTCFFDIFLVAREGTNGCLDSDSDSDSDDHMRNFTRLQVEQTNVQF